MLKLRQKLLIAFSGLFLLLVLVAGLGMAVINRVSQSFDRIFHENLETIRACREMGNALERMNEVLLVSLWENAPVQPAMAESLARAFEGPLKFQQDNVTVEGEQALTDSLTLVWTDFHSRYFDFLNSAVPLPARRDAYGTRILESSHRVRDLTRRISELNAGNILSTDGQVRQEARLGRRNMTALLIAGAGLTLFLLFFTGRMVLKPIASLTRSAREIEQGNLDLVLEARSQDELGQLAEAFNSMAARLREFRRSDRDKLVRTQKTMQTAINSLPDAVALLGADGMVEMSNDPATALFGIKPGTRTDSLGLDWLKALFEKVSRELRPFSGQGYETAIQVFREGKERFYLPHAVPILDQGHFTGVTVIVADVTELRKLDESKSDLLSTVSHELKTRLTSMRMAVHLMLDEKIGELNPRQADLLMAARQDAEHLHRLIEGLLDIGRIRSGSLKMDLRPVPARDLVLQSVEPVRRAFQDKGLKLECDLPSDLPPVQADPSRAHLVLDNLLSNALKYTAPGGKVTVDAEVAETNEVRFRVTDTGIGIPAVDLPRVFERFYRGVQEGQSGGAGLGLAIAKEVVEAHGGEITAESAEGRGSVFTFTLKAAKA